MIPKLKIHQLWIGDAEMPTCERAWVEAMQVMHPEADYHFWTEEEGLDTFEMFRDRKPDFENPLLAGDLLRYLILEREGGIYLDNDMIPVRPLDAIWEESNFFAGEEIQGQLCNALIGVHQPNHPKLQQLLENIEKGALNFRNIGVPFFNAHFWNSDELRRYPREYFHPVYWRVHEDYPPEITENTYMIHNFSGLWK